MNVYRDCLPSGGGGGGGNSASGGTEGQSGGGSVSTTPISGKTATVIKHAGKDSRALAALVRAPRRASSGRVLQSPRPPGAVGSAFDLGSGPTALLIALAGTAVLLLGATECAAGAVHTAPERPDLTLAAPPAPDVSVIVPTYEGRHHLEQLLPSLHEQTLPHDVIVVDNGSTDGTHEYPATSIGRGSAWSRSRTIAASARRQTPASPLRARRPSSCSTTTPCARRPSSSDSWRRSIPGTAS